jgi:predicted transcriptional regulator
MNQSANIDSLPVESNPQVLTVPIVATLLAKNYTPAKIGKVFNKSRQAVSQYIQRHKQDLEGLKNYDDIVQNQLKHTAVRVLESVDDADIKKAGLVGKMTAAGIALSKLSELNGNDKQDNRVLVNVIVACG